VFVAGPVEAERVGAVTRIGYLSSRLEPVSGTWRTDLSVRVRVEPVALQVEEERAKKRVVRRLEVTKERDVWSPKWRATKVVN